MRRETILIPLISALVGASPTPAPIMDELSLLNIVGKCNHDGSWLKMDTDPAKPKELGYVGAVEAFCKRFAGHRISKNPGILGWEDVNREVEDDSNSPQVIVNGQAGRVAFRVQNWQNTEYVMTEDECNIVFKKIAQADSSDPKRVCSRNDKKEACGGTYVIGNTDTPAAPNEGDGKNIKLIFEAMIDIQRQPSPNPTNCEKCKDA
ncbi:hypothetical protein CC78DRAFT_571409 [Lojkania enalia]|uniref:Uncharacterized protein n=1 Tax=Lojkania enalia TaxID=147567 RepID=A0A9P4K0X6_9PLEO|nr:hypothetical protein CC78DRAFT_571409 [Didymosphaeria enalia]